MASRRKNPETDIAILGERIRELKEKIDTMSDDVSDMKGAYQRYRGGFIFATALGSIVGLGIQIYELVKWYIQNSSAH